MERKELIASVPWGVCVSTCTQHVGSFASRSQTSSMSTLKKPTEANYNICTCFFKEEIRILATTLDLSQSRVSANVTAQPFSSPSSPSSLRN